MSRGNFLYCQKCCWMGVRLVAGEPVAMEGQEAVSPAKSPLWNPGCSNPGSSYPGQDVGPWIPALVWHRDNRGGQTSDRHGRKVQGCDSRLIPKGTG